MSKIRVTREPSPSDKQTVRELFYALPLIERAKPILSELTWVLLGRRDLGQHEKILPDYCYNIFDAFQKTYFRGFPLFGETLEVTDQSGLATAKTIEAAKKVLRLDWKNLGRLVGIGMRCIRFAELEAADTLKREGFDDVSPEKNKELFAVIMGKPWAEAKMDRMTAGSADPLIAEALKVFILPWIDGLSKAQPRFGALAYQWSPSAMAEFNEGMAEGTTSFLDESGQLAGESSRSGIYAFLLLAWPEIKAMLESDPRKTLSDLHKWMKPFMCLGVTAYIEIETLRDVCAPPPSGIGLSLRPLKVRPQKSSP